MNNIKKIYQNAGKCDDQQKLKDIIDAALLSTPEGVTDNSPNVHTTSTPVNNREEADFAVEEVRTYGPNVISFKVVTRRRQWYIIGCYIAPDDARTIERVVTALGDQP